jgi:hypothetical protein
VRVGAAVGISDGRAATIGATLIGDSAVSVSDATQIAPANPAMATIDTLPIRTLIIATSWTDIATA